MNSIFGDLYGQDLTWLKNLEVQLRSAIEAASNSQMWILTSPLGGERRVQHQDLPVLTESLFAVHAEIDRQEAIANQTDPQVMPKSRVVYPNFSGSIL